MDGNVGFFMLSNLKILRPWSRVATLTIRRKYQFCVEVSENMSSSISCPADSRINFDPTGNSLLLAWGACCPSSPWPGLPMAMNAFIGSENVLVSQNSCCLLLLLRLMLPSSLAQRVETSQGPVIGQRWYKNIKIFIFQKLFERSSKKFQNIFHWLSVQRFNNLRLVLLSALCVPSSRY